MSTSKFFKDNKTARARRLNKCSLYSLKSLQVLITPIFKRNNVPEKTLQKVKTDEILKACGRYL